MTVTDGAALTPERAQAARHLAAGATSADVAEVCGVSLRTVKRWRARPDVQAEVRRLTAEGLARAARVLSRGAADAAELLVAVSAGKVRADQCRINAARLVLTLGPPLRDSVELEERITALENERSQEPWPGTRTAA